MTKNNLKVVKPDNKKTQEIKEKNKSLEAAISQIDQNFGKGSISNIEGFGSSTKACVNFDNFGEKTLLLKFAKLKLLNN